MFVLDTSGSMGEPLGDRMKIDIAKETLKGTLERCNDFQTQYGSLEAGLIAFDGSEFKSDILTAAPLGKFNHQALTTAVDNLSIGGGTPLAKALYAAERELLITGNGAQRYIIALTDGQSNVSISMDQALSEIARLNNLTAPTQVFVFPFAINDQEYAEYFGPMKQYGVTIQGAKSAQALEDVFKMAEGQFLEDPKGR
jgi:hypothetical protein